MPEPETHSCLNCDAPAPGRFCPSCGQSTLERRAPFLTLVRELLDHLSLDTALPRSLFNLLLRPGRLTELYLVGRRAAFVPPLRMYLVLSLVFFVVFTITPPDVSQIEVYVGGELVGPAKTQSAEKSGVHRSLQILSPTEEMTWLNRKVEELMLEGRRERFKAMDPQDLVDKVLSGLQRHLKMALFVFLPLLALALKLLFLRSGKFYFDHLIFALHFQSFLFLGLLLIWVFHAPKLYLLAALVLFPVYLLLAMRRVYAQRWHWLIPKFLALGMAYFMLLGFVFSGVMLVVMRAV